MAIRPYRGGHDHHSNNVSGTIPTTERMYAGDLVLKVLKQSQQTPRDAGVRATPWQQFRLVDSQPTTVTFCYVIALCSRQSKEIWICDMTSPSPDEVLVNNGEYKMMLVCPNRGVVVGNSSVDSSTGNQLPSYARLFTLSLQVDAPMIYNATLQLIKEHEGDTVVCDEIAFSIRTNIPEGGFSSSRQSGNVLEIDYPLPKLKLTGVLKYPFAWSIIMYFEDLADNGQFLLYRRHRKILEKWAKTRPQYQDLVAMILLEEGVACLIQHRLEEGINLAKKACRLSSYYSCVNDRAIRGYASAVYAAADRFAGDQDGARQRIVEALEIFEPMEPTSYTSITLYNIGAITMERSAIEQVSEAEEKEAESFLHKAAEHWMHQHLNTTARVLPRVYNRLISLYLKCSPNGAPDLNKAVSQDSLTRAGAIIRRFNSLFPHCSNWMSSTFCLCKTDHCIRSRDIDGGLTAARKALEISMESGLRRETTGAIRRIELLNELDELRQRPPEVPDRL